MKKVTEQILSRSEITAIDRRQSTSPKRSKHKVQVIRRLAEGIIFQSDWQFPVPACRRRFFLSKREIMVEESGKIPGRDIYQFTGIFLRKSAQK
jgi:hypothetical protein